MQADHCQSRAEPEAYFRAAAGDHDAQVEMAHLIVAQGLAGDTPFDEAVALALFWGHMAATSGKATHLLAYAGLLLTQASRAPDPLCGAYDEHFATALAIVDAVADVGHHRAEVVSFALASRVSAAIIARATALKDQFVVEPLTKEERQEDTAGLVGIVEALGADAVGSC